MKRLKKMPLVARAMLILLALSMVLSSCYKTEVIPGSKTTSTTTEEIEVTVTSKEDDPTAVLEGDSEYVEVDKVRDVTVDKVKQVEMAAAQWYPSIAQKQSANIDGYNWNANAGVKSGKSPTVLNINTNEIVNRNYAGHGLQMDVYGNIDLPQQRMDQVYNWLGWMKMGTVRSMQHWSWYTVDMDNAPTAEDIGNGDPVFIWTGQPGVNQYYTNASGNKISPFNGRVIDAQVKMMEKVYDQFTWFQKNNIDVVFGCWGHSGGGAGVNSAYTIPGMSTFFESMLGTGRLGGALWSNDPAYAKALAGLAEYMQKDQKLTSANILMIANEYNITERYTYQMVDEAWRRISNELKDRKLDKAVRVTGPGTSWAGEFDLHAVLKQNPNYKGDAPPGQPADPIYNDKSPVADHLGVINFQRYFGVYTADSGNQGENDLRLAINTIKARYPNHPVFLTETGFSNGIESIKPERLNERESTVIIKEFCHALILSEMELQWKRAGLSGSMSWLMDDVIHSEFSPFDNYKPIMGVNWKAYGFWNSLGEFYNWPEALNPRPHYYTMALNSRMFQKGFQIVSMERPKDDTAVFCTAGIRQNGDRHDLSIVLTNRNDQPLRYLVKTNNAASLCDLAEYKFVDSDFQPKTGVVLNKSRVNADLTPKVQTIHKNVNLAEGFILEVPPQSYIALTTMDGGTPIKLSDGGNNYVLDDMYCLDNTVRHSTNLGFNSYTARGSRADYIGNDGTIPNDVEDFRGDFSRIHRNNNTDAELIYEVKNVKDFRLGYYVKMAKLEQSILYVSVSDTLDRPSDEWTYLLTSNILPQDFNSSQWGEFWRYRVMVPNPVGGEIPAGMNYIKIELISPINMSTPGLVSSPALATYADLQLTYFEAADRTLPPLEYLGADHKIVYTKPGVAAQMPAQLKLRFQGGYSKMATIEWENATFSTPGLYNVRGKVSGTTDVYATAMVAVRNNLYDECWNRFFYDSSTGIKYSNLLNLGGGWGGANHTGIVDYSLAALYQQSTGHMVYQYSGARKVDIVSYSAMTGESAATASMTVSCSTNGTTWTTVTGSGTMIADKPSGDWDNPLAKYSATYTLPSGTTWQYVRVAMNKNTDASRNITSIDIQ